MAAASTLAAAAGQSYDNLTFWYGLSRLKLQLTLFWEVNLHLFPESDPGSHPVANWFIVLASFADLLTPTNVPISQLADAANLMYRLCWMAQQSQNQGLITTDQGDSLLASYNALIATP